MAKFQSVLPVTRAESPLLKWQEFGRRLTGGNQPFRWEGATAESRHSQLHAGERGIKRWAGGSLSVPLNWEGEFHAFPETVGLYVGNIFYRNYFYV